MPYYSSSPARATNELLKKETPEFISS